MQDIGMHCSCSADPCGTSRNAVWGPPEHGLALALSRLRGSDGQQAAQFTRGSEGWEAGVKRAEVMVVHVGGGIDVVECT